MFHDWVVGGSGLDRRKWCSMRGEGSVGLEENQSRFKEVWQRIVENRSGINGILIGGNKCLRWLLGG